MADLSREEKVSAAQLKLQKFREAKRTSKIASSLSSEVSGSDADCLAESGISQPLGKNHDNFQRTCTKTPSFGAQTEQSSKSRSLADYFNSPNGVSDNQASTHNTPEWLYFTPSCEMPHQPSLQTTNDQFHTEIIQNQGAFPLCDAHTVPPSSAPPLSGLSAGSVVTSVVDQQYHNSESTENNTQDSFDIDACEEGNFDDVTTATTERIMQLSRQLNGILETSEQLTSTFRSSAIPSTLGEDPSRISFDGHILRGACSRYTTQSSPTSSTIAPHDSVLIEGATTPNSLQSVNHGSSYVRELEERNVQLASLLEKRSRAHERALAKLSVMEEQSTRAANQAARDRTSMEAAAQRDLSTAQEQIRAHAQTIGALVAEKTELQTKVQHLERLAQTRAQEINDLNECVRTFRTHSVEMESAIASSRVELEKTLAHNKELSCQLERLQVDVNREKSLRENYQAELEEANSRLNACTFEITELELRVNDLRHQLELAQVYPTQLNNLDINDSEHSPISSTHPGVCSSKDCLTEREQLVNRLREHEQSMAQMSKERDRLESQYQSYVAQVEQQAMQLRAQLSETNRSSHQMELELEALRCDLRKKEDELFACRGELETARTQLAKADSTSNQSMVVEPLLTRATPPSPLMQSSQVSDLQQALDERTAELDNLKQQVCELTSQLQSARAMVAEKETLLADRDMVLATATSERVSLSRAMEQNRKLKEQLTQLQDSFAQLSDKNLELSTSLKKEQEIIKEKDQMEANCQAQLEQLRVRYSQLEAARKVLQVPDQSHVYAHEKNLSVTESATLLSASSPSDSSTYDAPNEHLDKLMYELNASHRPKRHTIDRLSSRVEELDSIVHRIGLLSDWLHTRQLDPQPITRMRNVLSEDSAPDAIEQFAQLDRLIRTIVTQRDEEVANQARQNQENQTLLVRLPSVDEWETHQSAFKQLETKFIACMDKLSSVEEERARLESLNAQLEMEASTVGEYITLFAHRRAAASRRARAREQLLRRLLQDRRRLRSRLHELMCPVQSNGDNQSASVNTEYLPDSTTSIDVFSKVLIDEELRTQFLTNFQLLLQEVSPSAAEAESDSGFSLLNDEDAAEQNERVDSVAQITNVAAESGATLENRTAGQTETQLPTSPLEQLRKQALQHDCPHCQCCVGNLIEV